MPYENNGTLRKWHITNVPPKVDKYDTHKNDTPCQKIAKCYLLTAELSDFLK